MSWGKKLIRKPLDVSAYFKPAETLELKHGLKVGVYGPYESGKTYFALTFPEPVFVIDTEFGVYPVLRHFKDKDIRIFEAAILDPETDMPDPEKSLEKIEEAVAALRNVNEGTIVIDSGTDIWQWMGAWMEKRATRRTASGQPYRFEWAMANLKYRQLILRLAAKPLHFVITAQTTSVYDAQGRETGEERARWQKQTVYWCDFVFHLEKRFAKGMTRPKYIATLEKCRPQRAYNLEIEDITFDKFVKKLREDLGITVRGYSYE